MPVQDPQNPTLAEFLAEDHVGKILVEHLNGYGWDREYARSIIIAVRMVMRRQHGGNAEDEPYVFIETDDSKAYFEGFNMEPEDYVNGTWRLYAGYPFCGYYTILPK